MKRKVKCNHDGCGHIFETGATTMFTTCNGCMGKIKIKECLVK